jgi:hypothetical protein
MASPPSMSLHAALPAHRGRAAVSAGRFGAAAVEEALQRVGRTALLLQAGYEA